MATKKKTNTTPSKKSTSRAPSLNERITDFSTGGFVGKPVWTPKGTPAKKSK